MIQIEFNEQPQPHVWVSDSLGQSGQVGLTETENNKVPTFSRFAAVEEYSDACVSRKQQISILWQIVTREE